ncbi:MAG: nuclear transport factor 2 family protein [Ignavibacteriae bacterium]|nr:nuclear transport factor 2 family protein [Ignavibacteriota bacterium]
MLQPASITQIILFGLAFIAPTINGQNNVQGLNTMNRQIVQDFASAINEHNVDKMCLLMTDDHRFIDSQGNEAKGKEKMRAGWIGYFQLFPDYKIEIIDIFLGGDTVAAFGFAGGTFQGKSDREENFWHLPASWKAVIKNGKIQLWQVYADSKIPYDIINKNKKQ